MEVMESDFGSIRENAIAVWTHIGVEGPSEMVQEQDRELWSDLWSAENNNNLLRERGDARERWRRS